MSFHGVFMAWKFRFFSLFLFISMMFALASCGNKKGESSSSTTPPPPEEISPIPPAIDPTPLSPPLLLSPLSNPFYSNGDSLIISGSCEDNATVWIEGDASDSVFCVSNHFAFSVSVASDNIYNFSIFQVDLAGNSSSSSLMVWNRDKVVPSAPVITSHANNPFISGDTTFNLSGSCEPHAHVALSGSSSSATDCSLEGIFSFVISESTDSTYDYSVIQTDLAGNVSSGTSFQWTRDTSMPFTPNIQYLGQDILNPLVKNGSDITLTASCDPEISPDLAVVSLSGDVIASEVVSPAGSLTQNCTTSPVSFTIHKTVDSDYSFIFIQENPNNSLSSGSVQVVWHRDTLPPAVPVISSPSSNPFVAPGTLTLIGSCEDNATVYLSGSDNQSVICAGGFSFVVLKSVDGTYDFSISQTDVAGNPSTSSASFQWVRDSNSVPPPTIQVPASSPVLNNKSSFIISGLCNDGYLITLSGNVLASEVSSPGPSLTQICSGGSFTFVIDKSQDGSYTFNLIQTFNATNSSVSSVVWNRDTLAPVTTLSSAPSSTNIKAKSNFIFSASEPSTFQCKLDSGSYSVCSSPVSYASLSNGPHTFYVKASDAAGNVENEKSYTWSQLSHNAIALYHFNNGTQTVDSGLYTQQDGYTNTLVATGTPADDTSGKYPTSSKSSRTLSSANYYTVNDNATFNTLDEVMTVEGFFKADTLTTGTTYSLISKNGGSSGTYGWDFRIKKTTSTKCALIFYGSIDNSSAGTEAVSNQFNCSTGTWYYFSVTWNLGTVKFYKGTSKISNVGTKTIGVAGSAKLAFTSAPLKFGNGSGTTAFTGKVDEVRISQTVRSMVTFPSGEFTAD